MADYSVSIVIPVYRATDTLAQLLAQSREALGSRLQQMIYVYDCGHAESWQAIVALQKIFPEVVGIKLSRNYGQHNATICGFEIATSDFVVTMDEDLQHPPASIPTLVAAQQLCNADVVYGVYHERMHSWFRNITSLLLNRLLKLGIPQLHSDYSSFRLLRTVIAKQTIGMHNSYTFLDGYLTWITANVCSVKIPHAIGQSGKSSYTLRKLISHSLNIFVTFSSLPIRMLTYSSILFFIASSVYSLTIIFQAIIYKNVALGFPTLVTLLGFGFGFVLLGMGILGEYIQRINLKTTNRPNYIISEKIG